MNQTERQEINSLLHQMWSKDVGTKGYDKQKWKRLEHLIDKNLGPLFPTGAVNARHQSDSERR